ncbi:phycobilisome rod-core linker polypeptide [Oxynema sp. CENA135]|uniref:phycobilisome rod-core linker polypeptide n=1 Tax=Oxynema sp. CENA135 TaxID=984206 RepID=UPI00190CD070|nr:phycobilisome rod-core linker polypeptide [Oxynema sp. CENA135]MBK4729683.1 phycobilisome rod-core linker polypeptide [Oxynema sp. CENA135]
MTLHQPVTMTAKTSTEERSLILKQIYEQVLERQPYASERRELAALEKPFVKGKMGIRHFLKNLGVSPVYLAAFYEKSSNVKFIENCFKHFLGRVPHNEREIRACDDLLLRKGVGAMVSALIDSDEYRKTFGSYTVPYWHPRHYESPNDYLENQFVESERAGDRGWALPTLYWHELHLDCSGGRCRPAWVPSSRVRNA